MRLALRLTFVLALVGCATQEDRVNPGEMSAAQHRREAEKERREASIRAAQFDPEAVRPKTSGAPLGTNEMANALPLENPTEHHLRAAERHRKHADAHERAATELERFVDVACQGIPERERGACPILGPVTGIRDIDRGVRVELSPRVSLDTVLANMRCHQAYARARGFEGEALCPLYVKDVRIERARDGKAIELLVGDAGRVAEIRRLAREEAIMAPAP